MKLLAKIGLLIILPALFVLCCTQLQEIKSPDGNISVKLTLSETGACSFSFIVNNDLIVENGQLGIRLEEKGFEFTTV